MKEKEFTCKHGYEFKDDVCPICHLEKEQRDLRQHMDKWFKLKDEQMKNFLEPGDMVLSFSVSGSSSNLVEAHRYARKTGAKTACIVADKDGKLISMSDFAMVVPSTNYGVVEDIHIILGHAISQEIYANNKNL